MGMLKDTYSAFEHGEKTLPSEDVRTLHREAAVLASMTGSAELVDAIDDQYQYVLDVLVHIRRGCADELERSKKNSGSSDFRLPDADIRADIEKRLTKTEQGALRIINILRKDTGVPGKLVHQWF
jgi:hypothetical protein